MPGPQALQELPLYSYIVGRPEGRPPYNRPAGGCCPAAARELAALLPFFLSFLYNKRKKGANVTMDYTIHPIAYIRSDFTDKFGIPRQSGLVPELTARIVFEPEYRCLLYTSDAADD